MCCPASSKGATSGKDATSWVPHAPAGLLSYPLGSQSHHHRIYPHLPLKSSQIFPNAVQKEVRANSHAPLPANVGVEATPTTEAGLRAERLRPGNSELCRDLVQVFRSARLKGYDAAVNTLQQSGQDLARADFDKAPCTISDHGLHRVHPEHRRQQLFFQ